jgi:hypothetical protein
VIAFSNQSRCRAAHGNVSALHMCSHGSASGKTSAVVLPDRQNWDCKSVPKGEPVCIKKSGR